MENHYQVIDQATWPRAMHCAVFRQSVEPCFCVTFRLDVTGFLAYVRQHRLSFTLAMVYAACRCANDVEAFRCRFPCRPTIPLWTASMWDSLPTLCRRIWTVFAVRR